MVRKRLLGLVAVLALGACRDETTSGPAAGLAPSFHREGSRSDALQFSEWSAPVNLGPVVNSPFTDFTPEISKDRLSLYFSSNRPGGFGLMDLWVSHRLSVDAPWGPPTNLGPAINTSANEAAPHLSPDGHDLFFSSNRAGGLGSNDNWVSRRAHTHDASAWEAPVNLGPPVNGPSFDAGASLRRPELYFTSDRATGGPLDVYLSLLREDGRFGPAILVAELSSDGNDLRPSIRFDGLEIVLSSDRAGSVAGSQDIWVSTRTSDAAAWSLPVNLGPGINSEFQEQQPAISGDGTMLLFASDRPGGGGLIDLWVTTRNRLHRTVLVDPNERGDGTARTIQEGIDMVAPGGRVRVAPGTYHEQVTVSKNDVVIVADDEDDDESGAVVLNAHGHEFGFLVLNASGVKIQGFRVEHAHEADIGLNGATFTTIRENVTTAAGHDGIQLMASNDNVIEDNIVVDNLAANACGVNVGAGSQRNVVRDNRLVNNEWGIQIAGAATLDNVISENRAVRNRGNGIRNVTGASGTIIEDNVVVENGLTPSPMTTGTTAAGIRIGSGMGIVVRENRLFGNLPVELLQDAAATATFAENQCGTSSPAGLCEAGEDDNGEGEPE